MSIKLNRKGAGLAGEDRVKENQNLEMIEQEFNSLDAVREDSAAAKLSALEALAKADAADSLSKNVQSQLNTIVVEGDSSPQATQASVGAGGEDYGGNLKARLDAEYNAVTTQLDDKAQKAEVRKDTFTQPINVSEMDTETKALFTGGAVAVVGIESTGTENLKRKAVIPENTTFVTPGKNLFNADDYLDNQQLNITNGQLSPSIGNQTVRHIPVNAGEEYTLSRNGVTIPYSKVVFETAGREFISGLDAPLNFTTPANTAHISISVPSYTRLLAQLEKGATPSNFEPYRIVSDKLVLGEENLGLDSVAGKNIKRESISVNKLEDAVPSKNLFDKNAVTINTELYTNGNTNANPAAETSDFAEVKPNTTYTIHRNLAKVGSVTLVYYNERNEPLASHQDAFTTTSPEDTYYARFSYPNTARNTLQFEEGNAPTSYEDHYFTMPKLKVPPAPPVELRPKTLDSSAPFLKPGKLHTSDNYDMRGYDATVVKVFAHDLVNDTVHMSTAGYTTTFDTGKTLPATLNTSKKYKILRFKGNWYLGGESTTGKITVWRSPVVGDGVDFTWSAPLFEGQTGTYLMTPAFNADSSYMYLCEYGLSLGSTPRLFRSADGNTWETMLTETGTRHFHAVNADPYNLGHVWATAGDGVQRQMMYSTDYGVTWTVLEPNNVRWQTVQISFTADKVFFAGDNQEQFSVCFMYKDELKRRSASMNHHYNIAVPGSTDRFRVNAFYGAVDPQTGIYYCISNDVSNGAGQRMGLFMLPDVGQNLSIIDDNMPMDGEVFIFGGNLWCGKRRMQLIKTSR